MADAVLSVELQARVDAFVANLLSAANASTNTATATTQMSTTISRNVANVNRTNLTQFTAAMNAGTLSVNRLGAAVPAITRPIVTGSNQAANALTNLGRVAQDAPFGFIGIQNNLNPLLESFQRLRAETGSNGAAFRALGSSLMGPAGIGIALSLVTSAITIYTMYQQKVNKATNDAKKGTDDYLATLGQLDQAQLKGSQNAQKELTDLKVLFEAYQNANAPLSERKKAYSEIQEQYPDYFKNIKFEQTASEATKSAYDKLTESILATAKARAASDIITKNASRQLENEQKIVDLNKQALKDQIAIDKARARGTVSGGAGITATSGSAGLAIAENTKLKETIKQINDLKTDSNILTQKNGDLLKYVNEQIEKGAKLPGSGGKDGKGTATIKPKALDLELPENEDKVIAELYRKISEINAPDALKVKAPKKLEIDGEKAQIQLGDLLDISNIDIEGDKVIEKLTKIGEDAKKAIESTLSIPSLIQLSSGTIGDAFSQMGEAIAIGGNVIEAAGAAIQKSFADILSALGDQFITMGSAKVAAGILATPFGAALVSQGAGLIALGAGLKLGGGLVSGAGKGKGGASGPTAFANGGIISGPTLGLMGEYAGAKSDPEVVAPLSKLKNLLGETDAMGNTISTNGDNYFFDQRVEIEGDKLVVLLERTQAKRKRFK